MGPQGGQEIFFSHLKWSCTFRMTVTLGTFPSLPDASKTSKVFSCHRESRPHLRPFHQWCRLVYSRGYQPILNEWLYCNSESSLVVIRSVPEHHVDDITAFYCSSWTPAEQPVWQEKWPTFLCRTLCVVKTQWRINFVNGKLADYIEMLISPSQYWMDWWLCLCFAQVEIPSFIQPLFLFFFFSPTIRQQSGAA